MIIDLITKGFHKIKCILGLHEISPYITAEINGKKFHMCSWCDALIDDHGYARRREDVDNS